MLDLTNNGYSTVAHVCQYSKEKCTERMVSVDISCYNKSVIN